MTATTSEFLTVKDVAEDMKVSTMTVRRLFQDRPATLKLETPRMTRKGRPHVTLRIPVADYERFKQERSRGFGPEIKGGRG